MRPRRPRTADAVDWPDVHAKLQRVQSAMHTSDLSAEQTRAILEQRAHALRQPPLEPSSSGDSLDILTFTLGTERYAIEMKYVREVSRLHDFTPVPGTPDFVVGVSNYRGQILCVLNLRGIVGAPQTGLTDLSRLIVIGGETAEFGVLADRTESVGSLRTSDLLTLPESGIGREFLLGVTRDALLVLDGGQLLHDSRLFVDQSEPGAP